jgi:hypothetical protein
MPHLKDFRSVPRSFPLNSLLLILKEEVRMGRDLINLRKRGCGGRRGIEGAVKVRTKRDYSRDLRKEFQRN